MTNPMTLSSMIQLPAPTAGKGLNAMSGALPDGTAATTANTGDIAGFTKLLGSQDAATAGVSQDIQGAGAASDHTDAPVIQPVPLSGKGGAASGNMLPLAVQSLPIPAQGTAKSGTGPETKSDGATSDETPAETEDLPLVVIPAFLAQDPALLAAIKADGALLPAHSSAHSPAQPASTLSLPISQADLTPTAAGERAGTPTPVTTASGQAASVLTATLPGNLQLTAIHTETAVPETPPAAATPALRTFVPTAAWAALTGTALPQTSPRSIAAGGDAAHPAEGASATRIGTAQKLDAKGTLIPADQAFSDQTMPDHTEAGLRRAGGQVAGGATDEAPRERTGAAAATLRSDTVLSAPAAPQTTPLHVSAANGNGIAASANENLSAGNVGSTAASETPQDFATLVSRLHEAREASGTQVVRTALVHSQFGHVALQFRPDDNGMSVAMSSADPDFAATVQTAAASALAAASTATGDATRDHGSSQSQQSSSQQSQTSFGGSQSEQKGSHGFAQAWSQERDAADNNPRTPLPANPDGRTGTNTQQATDVPAAPDPRGTIYA